MKSPRISGCHQELLSNNQSLSFQRSIVKTLLEVSNMAGTLHLRNEDLDIFPIENGDFPASHVSHRRLLLILNIGWVWSPPSNSGTGRFIWDPCT